MSLPNHYVPQVAEPRLQALWEQAGVYHYSAADDRPVYSIDTPPPTVSGKLHLGHTYSYTHADIFARYHRMRGENVFYPMGFDDNGLPTERLVEKMLGATAQEIGRQSFIEKCLQTSQQAESDYKALWQRLGLSIDWRYTYRTIDNCSQRIAQWSFLDLYHKGLIYRQDAPSIWCPECHTAIAQADVDDLERDSELITMAFHLESGGKLPIATTRPELLPACVAIFVHPGDKRFEDIIGQQVKVPLFDQVVTVLEDPAANPEIGTGAVMCCTFGDTIDKFWWYTHNLPHVEAIDRQGNLTKAASDYAGMPVSKARREIITSLELAGYVLDRESKSQIVPVHERCDTPIEFIMSQQWFIRLLDYKDKLIAAGEKIDWYPEHTKARYISWVENLAWDWCISRQRYYGIPFPLWYCQECDEISLAKEDQLPVDPVRDQPREPCKCGSKKFIPDEDILDTWATSSMSPQIVGQWCCDGPTKESQLYQQVYPFTLRPQAHEIIRTWAFYTITKSHFHFNQPPWKDAAISGWGIAGEGLGKISKSRGGGPIPPLEMINRYSADAVRYWASSTSLGKDAVISEDKIKMGAKLITKLWNVFRFSHRFLVGYHPPHEKPTQTEEDPPPLYQNLSPADRWILSRAQRLIRRVTYSLEKYEYAAAKSEVENFFWGELTDNYLEMCKQRLYGEDPLEGITARFTLDKLLLTTIKLFSPFLPYITETIYQELYSGKEPYNPNDFISIHCTTWPIPNPELEDDFAEDVGRILVEIATSVRRFKSKNGIALGKEIQSLHLATNNKFAPHLERARSDIMSITRAREIKISEEIDPSLSIILDTQEIKVALEV
jgi:valyl-tRNA synthetase